ncbi:MAG TPA: hypothetical protein VFS65_02320 [Candidatus Saccharimonadales bacterium]|nr:hypothetical protein [Candidatus Saccharimonadales bacterium]
MKTTIKESLKLLVADRYLLVLLSFLVLLALAFVSYIVVSVRPSELQLVSHYSAFGITHLYRDQWFYLLVLGLFGLVAAALHVAISMKLLVVKGRTLAIMFAWFGVGIMLFAWVTAAAVLNVWSPL